MGEDQRPLVMHIVHRFDTGGLENGVVNLVNHMPADAYRHMIVALTEVTDFRDRLRSADVECLALHKPPGHGARLYPRLWRLLRQHRPAIVHTRNLAALEMQVPAWAARVPVRIHGEHGRDVDDLDGTSVRHQRIRRLYSPFVRRYVALSQDLARYLSGPVGLDPARITQIYNGVDSARFVGRPGARRAPADCPLDPSKGFWFGTVGRMQAVKHQTLLAEAFVRMLGQQPALRERARLVLIGDGPLRARCIDILRQADAASLAWLPGERNDVADVMQSLDCFVLPSLGEGISNTILEAMSTALPVIATGVGGNAELVESGRTGNIVPPDDVEAMATAMRDMIVSPELAVAMGRAGRAAVEERFSLAAMVAAYQGVYDRELAEAGHSTQEH